MVTNNNESSTDDSNETSSRVAVSFGRKNRSHSKPKVHKESLSEKSSLVPATLLLVFF